MLRLMGFFAWRRRPTETPEPGGYIAPEFAADPFSVAAIAMAPPRPGVYILYRSERVIYIGMAAEGSGIRAELEAHRRGVYGECTRFATAFDYEVSADPAEAQRAYLSAYVARYGGGVPPCNENR